MTPKEIANYLENYNAWRDGDDVKLPPNAAELTKVIKAAVLELRKITDD